MHIGRTDTNSSLGSRAAHSQSKSIVPWMLTDVCKLFQSRSRRSVPVAAQPLLTDRHQHHKKMALLFSLIGNFHC